MTTLTYTVVAVEELTPAELEAIRTAIENAIPAIKAATGGDFLCAVEGDGAECRSAAVAAAAAAAAVAAAGAAVGAAAVLGRYQVLANTAYYDTCDSETLMNEQECSDFADWVHDDPTANIATLGLDNTLSPQPFRVVTWGTTTFGCNLFINTNTQYLYLYYDSDSQNGASSTSGQRAVCKLLVPPCGPPPPSPPPSPSLPPPSLPPPSSRGSWTGATAGLSESQDNCDTTCEKQAGTCPSGLPLVNTLQCMEAVVALALPDGVSCGTIGEGGSSSVVNPSWVDSSTDRCFYTHGSQTGNFNCADVYTSDSGHRMCPCDLCAATLSATAQSKTCKTENLALLNQEQCERFATDNGKEFTASSYSSYVSGCWEYVKAGSSSFGKIFYNTVGGREDPSPTNNLYADTVAVCGCEIPLPPWRRRQLRRRVVSLAVGSKLRDATCATVNQPVLTKDECIVLPANGATG